MILVKINTGKIDKTKLFKGEKGTYLDICLFESPNDKYGNDYVVAQSVSKAEREAGKKGIIIGNGKIYGQNDGRKSKGGDPEPF